MRKQDYYYLCSLVCNVSFFFLSLLWRYSPVNKKLDKLDNLVFSKFIMSCLGVFFFLFIMLGVLNSWVYGSTVLIKWEKTIPHIKYFFLSPLSSVTPVIYLLDHLMLFHKLLKLSYFFFLVFFSFSASVWIESTAISSNQLIFCSEISNLLFALVSEAFKKVL